MNSTAAPTNVPSTRRVASSSMSCAQTTAQATQTIVVQQTKTEQQQPRTIKLKLRYKPQKNVQWDGAIIDNEHLQKRISKKCCIYHKKRAFGESDSEDDSDYVDSSDDEAEEGARRSSNNNKNKNQHPDDCDCVNNLGDDLFRRK